MGENSLKIVDFAGELWSCANCKSCDKPENEYPCDECISETARMNSRKPLKWEEKE